MDSFNDIFYYQEDEEKGKMKQWVEEVVRFSSEYGKSDWSAKNVVGKPSFYPSYGDSRRCWVHMSHINPCDPEFLEVKFRKIGIPKELNIYETYNPGALVRVLCKPCTTHGILKSNSWKVIYEQETEIGIHQSRIKKIQFKNVNFPTNLIRIEFDLKGRNTWYEIDAIQLVSDISNTPHYNFLEDIGKFFNNEHFSDVVFQFKNNEKKLFAHKIILSARSTVFSKMFTGNFKEGTEKKSDIKIEQFSYDTFKLFLKYLYSKSIKIEENDIIELFMCADFYDLGDLIYYLSKKFDEKINAKNCISLFKKTEELNCRQLNELCLLFIVRNYQEAIKNKELSSLSKEQILTITKAYGNSFDY